MNEQRRQAYHDMIEAAARKQAEEHSWVSNLFHKRLVELEKQQNDYEHWRRSNNHNY